MYEYLSITFMDKYKPAEDPYQGLTQLRSNNKVQSSFVQLDTLKSSQNWLTTPKKK